MIVGDPQNGKTAILRALDLLRTNRPSGFRYHSHFAEGPATIVKVEVPEGSVAFSKVGTTASYSVVENGTESKFPTAGTSVPDKVTELLNLQDLNVQGQLDPHFLIADSPADIAREINRITNIDLVDKWTAALNRKKHTSTVLIGQASRKVTELSDKLKSLEGLEDAAPILKEAESKQRESDNKKSEWNSIRLLANELEDVELSVAMLEKVVTAESFLIKTEGNIQKVLAKKSTLGTIQLFCDGEVKIEGLTKSTAGVEELIHKIEEGIEKVNSIHSQLRQLEAFIQLDQEATRAEKEVEGIKQEYISLVEKLGKCPFCLTELTKKSMNHVLEHL